MSQSNQAQPPTLVHGQEITQISVRELLKSRTALDAKWTKWEATNAWPSASAYTVLPPFGSFRFEVCQQGDKTCLSVNPNEQAFFKVLSVLEATYENVSQNANSYVYNRLKYDKVNTAKALSQAFARMHHAHTGNEPVTAVQQISPDSLPGVTAMEIGMRRSYENFAKPVFLSIVNDGTSFNVYGFGNSQPDQSATNTSNQGGYPSYQQ